ncbi:parallel beta-helix domain-containing protein [Rhodanobacter sp. OK091]|uniref:parallel beta-helix domain-containing protein n=1 Tax=Rhodanobacter sp. OK091 TaxID=1881037 RepID=UPI000911FDA4|nr:parallel beta-helix domain-containing protein [Rhodanobacter sp. OK091]SHM39714.1 parallel beta-helix repeat-containing protein [Rhodanobacter sp. OK091]
MRKLFITVALGAALAGCGKHEAPAQNAADASFEAKLQEQLLDAKPGSVIDIPAGHYALKRGLSLRTDGVTIKGAGMDKTVLSFKGQLVGPEGLLVNANDFTIANLAIEDTKGDALKINQGKNITIHGVRIEWTDGPKTTNGAYGLYPVKTQNVLVEDSVVIGASDAGIYVGQSNNIIVRRNRAEHNVAGIEIENSVNADVYENTATKNTGGILVFNMPNLSQAGHATRVFKNKVFENNNDNFAAKGAAVASVPAGSGVVVNSNDKVEIFDNDIADNKTSNIIIASYFSTNYYNTRGVAADYNPYPKGIYVYGNRLKGGGDSPDGLKLKTLKTAVYGLGGHFPDVLWDGYSDPKDLVNGLPPANDRICIQDINGVLNADGAHDYKSPSTDTKPYQCALPKLPPVILNPEPKV